MMWKGHRHIREANHQQSLDLRRNLPQLQKEKMSMIVQTYSKSNEWDQRNLSSLYLMLCMPALPSSRQAIVASSGERAHALYRDIVGI